jgi:O-antigen ligase
VRRITYALSLLFIFLIPWEDSISTSGWGSLARVMGLALAAFWLVTILIEGRFRKPHAFHYLVLLFFLWNFLSVYWSFDASGTIQRVTTYSQIFLFMLVFWEIFQRPGELKSGLQAYVLGAYVLVAGTLYNYANGIVAVAFEGRYSAPGVNAVDMALSLILGLPMALHLFLNHGRGPWNTLLRFVNLAYLPLAIYAVILTGSRTSLLAALPFFVYIAATPEIKLQRKILIFAILLAAMVALLPFVPPAVLTRLGTIGSSIAGEDLGGRVVLWRDAIGILARHPILGTGGGTLDPMIGSAAHNTYVSVATETGFVGFLLFFSILAVVVYQALRSPEGHVALWIAILATWGIGVLSLSWEFRKLTWLILTLVVIAGSIMEPQAEQAKVQNEIPVSLRLERPETEAKPKAA